VPRELVCVAQERLAWREYDEPPLAPDEVRIQSDFSAAKHGTEMAMFKGYAHPRGAFDPALKVFSRRPAADPYGERGTPVGNMTVGRVVEAGPKVASLAVGERVLLHGHFRPSHVRRADRCWKLSPEISWQTAVCLDPADFALGAVRDGHVRVGDAVAVLGMGAIGLMAVQIARAAGASPIIASEPIATRRDLARRLGADLALDSYGCDVGLEVKKATAGRGADVVIDYSGAADALQDALRGVAYGGKVVAGAFPPPYEAGLDFGAEAHLNVPDIVFSRACSEPHRDAPRWNERRIFETVLRLMREGKVCGDEVVRPVVPFETLLQEYPKIATQPETFIKLGARYGSPQA
jgi:threonine dehydrogenase-like Zn-dependent dehydrogenase